MCDSGVHISPEASAGWNSELNAEHLTRGAALPLHPAKIIKSNLQAEDNAMASAMQN